MVKTIGKILYIAIAAIVAVMFGVLNYNTSADEAYTQYIAKADKAENSEDIIYAFSSFQLPYDKTPYATKNSGTKNSRNLYTNDVSVYGSINQINVKYYEKAEDTEATKTFASVEFVYYVLIRYPEYTRTNLADQSAISNQTGIRFYNADNSKYYDYHFVVSSTINKNDYVEKPLSNMDAIMKNARTMTTTYINTRFDYHFMLAPFSETMISYIKEQIGGNVASINLLDNEGKTVYDTNVTADLNFTQQFFTDLAPFRDAFHTYQNTTDDKAKEDAKNYINNFKLSDINTAKGTDYKEGLRKDEIYNASLVWRTIGFVFLFVISFALIYILFFHFSLIKRLVFRRSTSKTRYVPNKVDKDRMYQPKNKSNVINGKAKDVTPKAEEKKPVEEVKEEPKTDLGNQEAEITDDVKPNEGNNEEA